MEFILTYEKDNNAFPYNQMLFDLPVLKNLVRFNT